MNHGTVFSGIGGFELAAEWMGWKNVFHTEINPIARKVLKYYWPKAESYEDITKTDYTIWRGKLDILTGGWPCQKYSIAGSKVGNEPLKEHFLRVFRESKPSIGVLENVGNFIGEQFAYEHDDLCKSLEDLDYEVQTFDIDAASCGLQTMERHIWIIATSNSFRQKRSKQKEISYLQTLQRKFQGGYQREPFRWELPESRVCELGKGFPYELSGITLSKWHGEALQAIGNAVPPQVVYEIFKVIELMNEAYAS